jgi:hypothetical protein
VAPLSHPQVGSIVNFALMYLLAPVASASGAGARLGLAQKVFGEYYLRGWGAPTGHMFQPGFGLGARAVNFAYKGAVFAFIGMCAGLVGTATSNGLLELRKRLDPGFAPPVSRAGGWQGGGPAQGASLALPGRPGLKMSGRQPHIGPYRRRDC